MFQRFVGTMILMTSLMVGCSSVPKPPAPMPSHAYLPTKFHVSYWAFLFPGYQKVEVENGYLTRKTMMHKQGGMGDLELVKTEYFTPSESDWRRFWSRMDELGWSRWKAEYKPGDIDAVMDDGGMWMVDLAWKGKAVKSRGENTGPMPGNPRRTIEGFDHVMDAFDILMVPAPSNR